MMASFSLEQLDMVRRLKQSGLSKEDIVAAFDSFDACEKEFGNTFNLPISLVINVFSNINDSHIVCLNIY